MAISWTPSATDNALPVTRRGLGVASPDRPPDSNGKDGRSHRRSGANGLLRAADGQMVGLWVNGVDSDFSLGGSTAQGPTRRDFYAHNFVQPKLTISGQTTNNYEYNRLAAFIRRAQLQSINLDLPSGDIPPSALRMMIWTPSEVKNGRTVRGRHSDIEVEGFIPMVRAGAERFVTAHSYQFDFVILAVYRMLPALSDRLVVPAQTSSITTRMESGRTRVTKSKVATSPAEEVGRRIFEGARNEDPGIIDFFSF